MATFSSVTRPHVLSAIAEHDDRGPVAFLRLYGFSPTPGTTLQFGGTTYDAMAILAVAHRYATGRAALPEEMEGGKVAVGALLRKHGFEVDGSGGAPAPVRRSPRSAARASRSAATQEPEKPAPVCPTCYMTLPATGVCDSCG
ncbi:hypothetical protein UQW22_15045 [Isoptericola halotolerans]|uniref:hypothetical protein n=1 Tax=Isoptericola halotolerans TaxID=300560 RepID=UPI003890B423